MIAASDIGVFIAAIGGALLGIGINLFVDLWMFKGRK